MLNQPIINLTMEPENHTGSKAISTGEWIVTMLITAIPLVGFIMLFVWSFGSNTPTSKANWAKATLLWMVIAIVLTFVFSAIFGIAFFSAFSDQT